METETGSIKIKAGSEITLTPVEKTEYKVVSKSGGFKEIMFRLQLEKPASELSWRLCYYIMHDNKIDWRAKVEGGNPIPKNNWPKGQMFINRSISIDLGYSGSGFIYIFVDDGKNMSGVSDLLSNIVELPIMFVEEQKP